VEDRNLSYPKDVWQTAFGISEQPRLIPGAFLFGPDLVGRAALSNAAIPDC